MLIMSFQISLGSQTRDYDYAGPMMAMILQLNACDSTLKPSDFLHCYSHFTSQIRSRTE